MVTKDITYKQFVAHLDKGNRGYMKKPKSWQKVWFWWQSKKDKWFLNKAFDKRNGGKVTTEASSWITAKDMESHLSFFNRQGYKYHIDE
jgi:hypothetical protein|tara:strand:+ start:2708 stop:2974 length:267 start_codon:yes stop_codon:yes gene_type:complete